MVPPRERHPVTARGARAVERAACREIVARCGEDPRLFDLLTEVDPEHRPELLRVVEASGRPAGLVLLAPRRVLVAGTPVEGAVVALVAIDPAWRGRGLARVLLEDTMVYVGAAGFRVALVHGAPEFFRKFGFVPCLGNYSTVFDPMVVVGAAGGAGRGDDRAGVWSRSSTGDTPHLSDLHNRSAMATPGSVLRPAEAWVWESRRGPGGDIAVYRRSPGAAPSGYVREAGPGAGGPAGSLTLLEVVAADRPALEQCWLWSVRRAVEAGLGRVRFTGPPDHGFSSLAYLRTRAEVTRRPATTGQMAITNRGLLVADLAAGLAKRALAAGIEPGTRLVLDVGPKRIALTFTGGEVRVLGGRAGSGGEGTASVLTPETFVWLLVGYAGGEDLAGLPGAALAREHEPVLAALFPRAYPKWVPAPYW